MRLPYCCSVSMLAALCCLCGSSSSGAQDVTYELMAGSVLRDECESCDRASMDVPIEGTFVLATLPSGVGVRSCAISAIDWKSSGNSDYAVQGEGSYTANESEKVPVQEMHLKVDVNGVSGIVLDGGPVELFASWPVIDILVTEPKPHRDINHFFTVRLKAAPRAEMTPYGLLKESIFVVDCPPPCRPPTILIPIQGSFLLGVIYENPIGVLYRVDGIDFSDTADGKKVQIRGGGTYWQGGEVALLQTMDLELTVVREGVTTTGALLSSEKGPTGAVFPEILAHLVQTNPATIQVFNIDLDAKPEIRFRRGDANADGTIDISDGVRDLVWLFALGGLEPECLDAADADANLQIELTDAVYIFTYLFLGGIQPPEPGPNACGFGPAPRLGCLNYNACK